MKRRHRSLAAVLSAFAFAFAQAAALAHASALPAMPEPVPAMAGHDCCPGEDGAPQAPLDGNLCEHHCLHSLASVDNAGASPVAADVMAIAPLRVALPEPVPVAHAAPTWRLVPAAAPPPPAILFGVLRI